MLDILRTKDSGSYTFYGSDSEELYNKNRKSQPIKWPYHNKSINYTLNSYGYRAPEFETVDWTNCVAVFGCSCVFGIGVDDSDNVCTRLSYYLKSTVINLGIPGGSAMHIWALTTQLVDQGIRPKYCIYIWPSHNRVAVFSDNNLHRCTGSWTLDPNELGSWANSNHGEHYLKLAKESVKQQWAGVPNSHWTWAEHTYHTCGKFSGPFLRNQDSARDGLHYGPNTLDAWAKTISNAN